MLYTLGGSCDRDCANACNLVRGGAAFADGADGATPPCPDTQFPDPGMGLTLTPVDKGENAFLTAPVADAFLSFFSIVYLTMSIAVSMAAALAAAIDEAAIAVDVDVALVAAAGAVARLLSGFNFFSFGIFLPEALELEMVDCCFSLISFSFAEAK